MLDHARWLYAEAQNESGKALHATWGLFGVQGVLLALVAGAAMPVSEVAGPLQLGALLSLIAGAGFAFAASRPAAATTITTEYLRFLLGRPEGFTIHQLIETLLPSDDDDSPINKLRTATTSRLRLVRIALGFTAASLALLASASVVRTLT